MFCGNVCFDLLFEGEGDFLVFENCFKDYD